MKSIIVYYSGTGNTARIAKAIHRGMKGLMEVCDIARVKEVNPKDLFKYDLIGLGGPIGPTNIPILLNKMPDLRDKMGFAFCTHGAWPHGFFAQVVPAMIQKGLTIIGYNDWYGAEHRLPWALHVHPCEGHPDEIDMKDAEDFGKQIAERARRIYAGETKLIPKLPAGPEADPLWQPDLPHLPGPLENITKEAAVRGELRVNTEKCNYPACRLCLDICPAVKGIDFSVRIPVFKCGNMCLTCEGICPVGAIEVDYKRIFGAAEHRGASGVNHPHVKFLKEAEAKGRFRWLVPFETIYTSLPEYQIAKHPRYTVEK
jgi:ferredoxin